jgi:MRG-binding protein
MPPKKKNRGSLAKASTPVRDDDAMVVDTPEVPKTPQEDSYDILKNLWTDEQETSLFKGIIRWKPAGWFAWMGPL